LSVSLTFTSLASATTCALVSTTPSGLTMKPEPCPRLIISPAGGAKRRKKSKNGLSGSICGIPAVFTVPDTLMFTTAGPPRAAMVAKSGSGCAGAATAAAEFAGRIERPSPDTLRHRVRLGPHEVLAHDPAVCLQRQCYAVGHHHEVARRQTHARLDWSITASWMPPLHCAAAREVGEVVAVLRGATPSRVAVPVVQPEHSVVPQHPVDLPCPLYCPLDVAIGGWLQAQWFLALLASVLAQAPVGGTRHDAMY